MYPRSRARGLWLVLLSAAVPWLQAHAQSAPPDMAEMRAAMAASVSRQRESVELQIRTQRARQAVARPRPSPPLVPPTRPAFASAVAYAANCPPLPTNVLTDLINQSAEQSGVSPDLLRAVAHAESGFLPCAVSPKGARGLMQIMPATGWELGLRNPLDPGESLAAGAKYLNQLLARYGGNLRLALSAYNAGPARVDRYGDVPPIVETQNYVRRILSELSANPDFAEGLEAVFSSRP